MARKAIKAFKYKVPKSASAKSIKMPKGPKMKNPKTPSARKGSFKAQKASYKSY